MEYHGKCGPSIVKYTLEYSWFFLQVLELGMWKAVTVKQLLVCLGCTF